MTGFDRHTALSELAPGRFAARFDAAWSSLRGVHGGYVAAHAVRAAQQVAAAGHAVRTLSVAFLRPSSTGEAQLVVTPVREGRSVAVHAVEVVQDGATIAQVRVTTAPDHPDGPRWHTDPLALPPPWAACEPISPPEHVRHFDNATARLDPASLPFSRGPRAIVQGWVRPLEPRPIDAGWLAMIMDWFPPSAFVRTEPPVGGVSVDYTVHVHRTLDALGEDGWLAATFRTDRVEDGLALEHGTLCDADGLLLAESFHTRLAR